MDTLEREALNLATFALKLVPDVKPEDIDQLARRIIVECVAFRLSIRGTQSSDG